MSTNMPLTHCHTCGRELPWNRIFVGDRAYCGAECLPVKTVGILPDPRIAALEADLAAKDARIAALEKERAEIVTYYEGMGDERLEADLAEALELLEGYVRDDCYYNEETDMLRPLEPIAARLLAKYGRFKIAKDDGDVLVEGEWVE